jgi:putative ABC transport system permease protein
MSAWRRVRSLLLRLAGTFGAGRSDRDIEEELATHRVMLEAEARGGGLDERAAAHLAAARFGSTTSVVEACRDQRGLPSIQHWRRDTGYALRAVRRSPLLFLSMIAVLGLGIGAGTAIVMVVHAVAWRSLPVPDGDRVVKLSIELHGEYSRRVLGHPSRLSYPEIDRYREASRAVSPLGAFRQERLLWRGAGDTVPLEGTLVSGRYFELLQVRPVAGRLLSAGDGHAFAAVISERFWREAFGAAPDAVGATIVLDRQHYTVVGVVAAPFSGTEVTPSQVWVPLETTMEARGRGALLSDPETGWLTAIGRLAPGISLAQARAEAAVIAGQLDVPYPGRRTVLAIGRATPADAGLFAAETRAQLVGGGAAIAAAIAVLLFICGSNVAGLLLARGASRQREIAVRLALGAGRGRIVQQLAAEVAIVTLAGAVLGVLVCAGVLRVMRLSPSVAPLVTPIAVDWQVLLVATLTAAAIGAIFGLAPARQGLRVDGLSALKGHAAALGSAVPSGRLRAWLIGVQVAIAVVGLAVGAVATRGAQRAAALEPGYPTDGLFIVQADLTTAAGDRTGPDDSGRIEQRIEQIAATLAAAPGIRSVGQGMTPPFAGRAVTRAGRPGLATVALQLNRIDDGYLRTLGVRVVAGRSPRAGEPDAVLVNSALARAFWGGEGEAVGQTLTIPASDDSAVMRAVQVVGVLPTLQSQWPGVADDPAYYEALRSDPGGGAPFLLVRADPGVAVLRLATDAARALDRDAFVRAWSVDEQIASRAGSARAAALIAWIAGLLALLVGAVGIHGVVAHAVVCRTRDIGVHIALGASRRGVLALVLRQTMTGAVAGAAGGTAIVAVAAVLVGPAARKALFGLNPLDPIAGAMALVVLAVVTLIAACLPARRALRISPVEALKQD